MTRKLGVGHGGALNSSKTIQEFAQQRSPAMGYGMAVGCTVERTARAAAQLVKENRFDYVLGDLMFCPPSYSHEGLSILRETIARQPEGACYAINDATRILEPCRGIAASGQWNLVPDTSSIKTMTCMLEQIMAKIRNC